MEIMCLQCTYIYNNETVLNQNSLSRIHKRMHPFGLKDFGLLEFIKISDNLIQCPNCKTYFEYKIENGKTILEDPNVRTRI